MLKDVNDKIEDVMYNYTLQEYVVWLYVIVLFSFFNEGF